MPQNFRHTFRVRYAEIALVQVHVDLATGVPQRIPDSVRRAMGHDAREPADG